MSRAVAIPHGSWPLEMRAETAAAYCDEPSVEAFLAKVARVLCAARVLYPSGIAQSWTRL
jgi:hypothetical protein